MPCMMHIPATWRTGIFFTTNITIFTRIIFVLSFQRFSNMDSLREKERDRSKRGDRISRFSDITRDRSNDRDRGSDCRRLFVSNIPYEFRWTELKDLFKEKVTMSYENNYDRPYSLVSEEIVFCHCTYHNVLVQSYSQKELSGIWITKS